ncbi:MAG: hypothetical protein MI922_18820 [Bacteroidales bacterium]|nr:hypothetical protein [Bacteroidales bacterium]
MDPINEETIVDDIEGTWKCEETSNKFKSTESFYKVYIEPLDDIPTEFIISNFYDLGNDVFAKIIFSGEHITIPEQSLNSGYTIHGSGSINKSRKTMELTYSVDDGSGQIDPVTANYTFLY